MAEQGKRNVQGEQTLQSVLGIFKIIQHLHELMLIVSGQVNTNDYRLFTSNMSVRNIQNVQVIISEISNSLNTETYQ